MHIWSTWVSQSAHPAVDRLAFKNILTDQVSVYSPIIIRLTHNEGRSIGRGVFHHDQFVLTILYCILKDLNLKTIVGLFWCVNVTYWIGSLYKYLHDAFKH